MDGFHTIMNWSSWGVIGLKILNIAAYQFSAIDNPAALAKSLQTLAQSHDLLGTILVAKEGLNLFLAGPVAVLEQWLLVLRQDARFAAIRVKKSYSNHLPFKRLKVRLEREIITFDPAINPAQIRMPVVSPARLKAWLDQGHDDAGQSVVLLDTRNREEVAIGSFVGALNPQIEKFTALPAAVNQLTDQLQGKTVVAFCTGGVRCEKAVPWLHAQGLTNSYQLDGGILAYFEAVGGAHWRGKCFVFDARIALDPALQPAVDQAPLLSPGQLAAS